MFSNAHGTGGRAQQSPSSVTGLFRRIRYSLVAAHARDRKGVAISRARQNASSGDAARAQWWRVRHLSSRRLLLSGVLRLVAGHSGRLPRRAVGTVQSPSPTALRREGSCHSPAEFIRRSTQGARVACDHEREWRHWDEASCQRKDFAV